GADAHEDRGDEEEPVGSALATCRRAVDRMGTAVNVQKKLACAVALGLLAFSIALPASADVILHAFDWKYTDLAQNAQAIADAGYRAVLVSPPLKSERSAECPWYKLYQPEDFRVIDNCSGNKQEFVAMINALNAKNVRVYADIVVNHMANE